MCEWLIWSNRELEQYRDADPDGGDDSTGEYIVCYQFHIDEPDIGSHIASCERASGADGRGQQHRVDSERSDDQGHRQHIRD